MGIDPGTTVMGYGIIKVTGKKLELLTVGAIELGKYKDHYLKLRRIFERTQGLIQEYHPDELAIEAPFYGKNVQSMLKLGRAQGVSMAAALAMDVPITEYLPKKVKQSVTGNGNASKEQLAGMVGNIFKIEKLPKSLDATDGLAVALCHYYQGGKSKEASKYSGWDSFLKQNPGRKLN